MSAIKTDHDALADKVLAAAANMGKFKDDIQEFLNSITGDTGMIGKLNCAFIGVNLNRVRKSLCYSFTPALFWFSVYIGLVGCCGCCAIPSTFYLNKNFGGQEKVAPGGKK